MIQFGSRIRSIRKNKGLTQAQLAEIVGVDNSYICKLENNQTSGNMATLNKVATALGVHVTELLKEEEQSA